MKTIVYTLEFSYSSSAARGLITVEITALSKYQLMESFLQETLDISFYYQTRKEAIKQLWDSCTQCIKEEELQFPIVRRTDITDYTV